MPDSRTTMLSRMRAAVAVGPSADEAISRDYQRTCTHDHRLVVEMLCERLREYDASVREASSFNVAEIVTNICGQHALKSIVVAHGFPASWVPSYDALLFEKSMEQTPLEEVEAVLTVSTVAIAHTGTLVLRHGPGEGARRLTLLPDLHICIVCEDQVVETVPEAFDALAPFATNPLTFISGPSATADIEMTRIRGVHGPRFLEVILVR